MNVIPIRSRRRQGDTDVNSGLRDGYDGGMRHPIDDLENRIDYQAMLLHTALTPAERRAAWGELTRLHALRSTERVQQMEAAAGIAP